MVTNITLCVWLQLDNLDEQAAQIRRELDGRLQMADQIARVSLIIWSLTRGQRCSGRVVNRIGIYSIASQPVQFMYPQSLYNSNRMTRIFPSRTCSIVNIFWVIRLTFLIKFSSAFFFIQAYKILVLMVLTSVIFLNC